MKVHGTVGCVLVCLVSGCPGMVENPAAVLEGTWQVTFAEPGDLEGFDIQAVFDANGQITQVTAESPDGAVADLNVDESATTEVDGDTVTITVPAAGGNRVLEGTLSEDQNTITGSLSRELELPGDDGNVTLPGTDLTLERIEE